MREAERDTVVVAGFRVSRADWLAFQRASEASGGAVARLRAFVSRVARDERRARAGERRGSDESERERETRESASAGVSSVLERKASGRGKRAKSV